MLGERRDLLLLLLTWSVLEWEHPGGISAAFSGDHSDNGLDAKEMTHGSAFMKRLKGSSMTMGQVHVAGVGLVNRMYVPHSFQHTGVGMRPEFPNTCRAVSWFDVLNLG